MKKKLWICLALALVMALCLGLTACGEEDEVDPGKEKTPKITLSDTTVEVGEKQTFVLKATKENVEGALKAKSSDTSVVKASTPLGGSITLTGIKRGTAKITVSCGDAEAVCDVSVVGVDSIALDQEKIILELFEGSTCPNKVTAVKVTKKDETSNVTFVSSDPGVFTVAATGNEATLTPKKAGTATLTAKVGTAEATCKVEIGSTEIKYVRSPMGGEAFGYTVRGLTDAAISAAKVIEEIYIPSAIWNNDLKSFEFVLTIGFGGNTAGSFKGCTLIRKVSVAAPIYKMTIGYEAFRESSITEFSLETGTKSTAVDYSVFKDCLSLKKLVLPKIVEVYGKGTAGEHRLQDLCKRDEKLETVSLPELDQVDANAFFGTNVKNIYIPKSISKFLEGNFNGSDGTNFENVYFGGTEAEWNNMIEASDADVQTILKAVAKDKIHFGATGLPA